jgi:hypothetical protein
MPEQISEPTLDCKLMYMDMRDYAEMEKPTLFGTKVFSHLHSLAHDRPCYQECGVIQVEIRVKSVVMQPNQQPPG